MSEEDVPFPLSPILLHTPFVRLSFGLRTLPLSYCTLVPPTLRPEDLPESRFLGDQTYLVTSPVTMDVVYDLLKSGYRYRNVSEYLHFQVLRFTKME